MSKVFGLKDQMGYRDKAPACGNCRYISSEQVLPKWMVEINENFGNNHYTVEKNGVEKNIRCRFCEPDLFRVKKTGWCPRHEPMPE